MIVKLSKVNTDIRLIEQLADFQYLKFPNCW